MRSPEIRLPGVVRVGFLLLIAHSSSYLLMKPTFLTLSDWISSDFPRKGFFLCFNV